MGGNNSTKLSKYHLLHYTLPDENKLYIFDTNNEQLYCVPVFLEGKPFFFGKLKTIICPQRQCLVIIGGQEIKKNQIFKYVKNTKSSSKILKSISSENSEKKDSQEESSIFDIENVENLEVSVIERHIDSGISLFAKIVDYNEKMLQDSSFVGIIDFRNPKSTRFNVLQEEIPQLEKPRKSHSLVYTYPDVYIIAGLEENSATKICLKFNILETSFTEIASIGLKTDIKKSACIIIENFIYVFDSNNFPCFIHKYNMIFDVWEDIRYKTPGFKICKSRNASVFRISKEQLIYINGETGDKNFDINYYVYDLVKDKFVQERSDKKLIGFSVDDQGNRNYSKAKKIYFQLSDKKVKVFYKDLWYWDTLEVFILKFKREEKIKKLKGPGCCGKRK